MNAAAIWKTVKRTTELLSLISVAISLPVGLYQLQKAQEKETALLVEKTYDDLDQRYIDFQKLCLQYPHLDVFDKPAAILENLTPKDRVQQKVLHAILLSILERAYLSFANRDLPSSRHQWQGWDEYATNFLERASFQATWNEVGSEFDTRFQAYMNSKLNSITNKIGRPGNEPKPPSKVDSQILKKGTVQQ